MSILPRFYRVKNKVVLIIFDSSNHHRSNHHHLQHHQQYQDDQLAEKHSRNHSIFKVTKARLMLKFAAVFRGPIGTADHRLRVLFTVLCWLFQVNTVLSHRPYGIQSARLATFYSLFIVFGPIFNMLVHLLLSTWQRNLSLQYARMDQCFNFGSPASCLVINVSTSHCSTKKMPTYKTMPESSILASAREVIAF